MSVTKRFEAQIAIGLSGIAVLSIHETLSPHSVYVGSDIHPQLVLEDIKKYGTEEWAGMYLGQMPKEPGVYQFRGIATFTDDDADYSVTHDCKLLEQRRISDLENSIKRYQDNPITKHQFQMYDMAESTETHNVYTKSLDLMDLYFYTVSDEDFITSYQAVEEGKGPTIKEYLTEQQDLDSQLLHRDSTE
ncbi:MAG: hypothetical protein JKY54_17310 [Flavobacteriales bacterium]|nr:hypothetical protein [Flavobacteriales bacterium]